jgi:hypothetical protein
MKKSLVSALALSALVAGAAFSGAATAQTVGVGVGTPIGEPGVLLNPQASQQGSMTSTDGALGNNANPAANPGANVGPGVGPGTRGGVGAPTDGLDSNPYAEAPPRIRAALGGRVNRSARTSASGTLD